MLKNNKKEIFSIGTKKVHVNADIAVQWCLHM